MCKAHSIESEDLAYSKSQCINIFYLETANLHIRQKYFKHGFLEAGRCKI